MPPGHGRLSEASQIWLGKPKAQKNTIEILLFTYTVGEVLPKYSIIHKSV